MYNSSIVKWPLLLSLCLVASSSFACDHIRKGLNNSNNHSYDVFACDEGATVSYSDSKTYKSVLISVDKNHKYYCFTGAVNEADNGRWSNSGGVHTCRESN